MAVGNFTLFLKGIQHIGDATVDLDGHTFKAVLCTSSQALSESFVGSSGDCRYADLTAELSTGSGYTSGGFTLTGVTWTIVGSDISFDANTISWSLTGGGVTCKYLVILDDTSANKNLLCFVDLDTGGGSISPIAGTFSITPDSDGIFKCSQ